MAAESSAKKMMRINRKNCEEKRFVSPEGGGKGAGDCSLMPPPIRHAVDPMYQFHETRDPHCPTSDIFS